MLPGLIPENNEVAELTMASSEWTEHLVCEDRSATVERNGVVGHLTWSELVIYMWICGPSIPRAFLCSLCSQLTCHGNWNLSQVFGKRVT